jgi:hypothetical membrane protein
VAVVSFVFVIVLAQVVAPPGYDWTRHTISDLAAQSQPHAWIMRAGFISFGLLVIAGLLVKAHAAGHVIARDLPLLGYAAAIALAGVFSTAPIDDSAAYSITEARWHSWLASTAGWCLSIGVLWYALSASRPRARWLHVAALAAITATSLAFGLAESGAIPLGTGVVQRVLYALGAWLMLGQWWDLSRIEAEGQRHMQTREPQSPNQRPWLKR